MPVHNTDEIPQRLLYLAVLRDQTEKTVAPLQQQIDLLSAKVKSQQQFLEKTERELREDILQYIQETGDLHVHPNVTFRRTFKLVYDKDEILEYVRGTRSDLIRVKEELKVREFESAWKNGEFPDANVEQINAPTLEIGKLGDLLIWEQRGNAKN